MIILNNSDFADKLSVLLERLVNNLSVSAERNKQGTFVLNSLSTALTIFLVADKCIFALMADADLANGVALLAGEFRLGDGKRIEDRDEFLVLGKVSVHCKYYKYCKY